MAVPVFGLGGNVLAAIELTLRDLASTLQPFLLALTIAARSLSRELAAQPRQGRTSEPTHARSGAGRGGGQLTAVGGGWGIRDLFAAHVPAGPVVRVQAILSGLQLVPRARLPLAHREEIATRRAP